MMSHSLWTRIFKWESAYGNRCKFRNKFELNQKHFIWQKTMVFGFDINALSFQKFKFSNLAEIRPSYSSDNCKLESANDLFHCVNNSTLWKENHSQNITRWFGAQQKLGSCRRLDKFGLSKLTMFVSWIKAFGRQWEV